MAGKWTGYFKVVQPVPPTTSMSDNQEMADAGAYNNYTWYQRLVQGSASRMTRYREYDLMDNDIEVSRALDTIAEEMTGNTPKTSEPLILEVMADDDSPESSAVLTAKTALRRWCEIHDFQSRLFSISRMLIKYGDVFFRKQKTSFDKWVFIHPKNVVAAIVSAEDATRVIAWQVRIDMNRPRTGGYGMPLSAKQSEYETEIIPARELVRFSLNDDMSDTQPFGESVLRPVYRPHKQKELLEDAIIIYRVQRAPERRVFYIDVGKMPPQRVKNYLETIKNEIKQKRVPTTNGGQSEIDSVYNPQSMSEDFFFASRPDGRGSRVETLPGGQGLGELADLEYFQRKVWRGLKVPSSYMIEQQEGGQIWNDGKVGIAYIQELRFSLYVERLQGYIERTLDEEFKLFLRQHSIIVDETAYRVRLPEPSNFGKYRQLELDGQLLGSYSQAENIPYLSARFKLKRFLQLSDEEIILNERLLREEMGLDPDDPTQSPTDIYNVSAEGGLGGGLGGGFGGGFGGAELGMGGAGELGGAGGASPPTGGEVAPTGGTAPV